MATNPIDSLHSVKFFLRFHESILSPDYFLIRKNKELQEIITTENYSHISL